MGGIAQLAKSLGIEVSGCDAGVYPPMSDQLKQAGIHLIEGYDPEQLDAGADLYIIGNAISRGLAAAGGTVALCGRNLEKCRALMDEITASGGTASAHRLDVADLDSIHACVDEVAAQYGKIDVLFNIAGINKREGLLDVTPETYDRIMDTNLKGLFFVSQAVAREMYRYKSGNIVNIGSHNDTGMLGGCSVYGASKSGVVALYTYQKISWKCMRFVPEMFHW